jgi:hypothetical protein
MVARWLAVNVKAEAENDWKSHLGPMYADDAEYLWNLGPNEELVARGRRQIEEVCLGSEMEGLDGWTYPYDKILIDDKAGEVVGFWRQVAPTKRADGTPYEVAGVGGSWFRYGGDFKWSWQRDFFDLGNVLALFAEMAGDGNLNATMKARIHELAHGKQIEGKQKLREGGGVGQKVKAGIAMARIVTLGR